jgi:4-hydroxy-tetrahydrodipicolinate synthase
MTDVQKIRLPGSIVPPLTPFTGDLKVDYEALKRMVDYVVEDCDAAIVIAAGVEAQEYQFLDFNARKELIAKTIEFVAGRKPVIVGISHPSYRIAIELADFSAMLGAAGHQLLAPMRPTGGMIKTSELIGYYQSVLRETTLPMMLYLNAGPGSDVSVHDTVELSKMDRIAWVKESSRDMSRVSRLIEEIEHRGHAHYFTTMQMYLPTLMLGGSGVTLPPPAAIIARKIAVAFVAGNHTEAARLQRQFTLFPARWMPFGLAAVMKAAMTHLGIAAGDPFPPYEPVTGTALDQLKACLDGMDLPQISVGEK